MADRIDAKTWVDRVRTISMDTHVSKWDRHGAENP